MNYYNAFAAFDSDEELEEGEISKQEQMFALGRAFWEEQQKGKFMTWGEWCDEDEARTCYFITHEPEQHRDTSVYNNHTRVVQKRGRSSVVQATGSAKRMRKI